MNEPYHRVENDEVVKSIFNSRKRKGLGIRIPEWILTEEMKQTKHYKLTPSAPRPPNPQEQQGESSALKKSIIIKFLRRRKPDLETLVLTTTQIDVVNLDEATQMSIATARKVEEESAEDALIRKKGKGIVEIKDTLTTTTPRSPRTHTDSLSSDKEKLKELTASEPTSSSSKPMTSCSKHIEGAIARMNRRYGLIFHHMKKSFMPRKDMDAIGHTVQATLKEVVPMVVDETTNDSIKKKLPKIVAKGIRLEREKVKADIASMVDSFLQNYMNNHILHVHPNESASSTILDLQQQLYLKMKDDEQARDADLPIWLALKYKYEKSAPHVEPCRVNAFRSRDHKDHHDDDARPKGRVVRKRKEREELQYHLDQMKRYMENVIRVQYDQGYRQEYMEEIMVKRADGEYKSFTELDYKYLHKNDMEDIKKEKRYMNIDEILKFCDATLKRILEKVKKINMDVMHGYADPTPSNDGAEFMRFYEEYIQERLKHRDHMRRWESYVNGRPLEQRKDHPE
ncbi:hypothetical protein Tco_0619864 [Tanacetum coccineum]